MNRPRYTGPPRWAQTLLRWWAHPDTAEEVQGDLLELYDHWVRTQGERKADWRYSLSALKLLRPLAKSKHVPEYVSPFFSHPDMFRNYLKIAWRTVIRSRGLSSINIAGLSIGLAAVMFIMLFVQDEVSYDRFHTHVDHLYRIVQNTTSADGHESQSGATGLPQGPAFAEELPEVADFCRVKGYEMLVRQKDETAYRNVMYVDTSFFRLFSFNLLAGNSHTLLTDPGSVVITDDMARTYFGTTSVLNRLLAIDAGGRFEHYRITGVVKAPPTNSTIRFDLLRPFVASLPPNRKDWGEDDWTDGSLSTFLLLHAGDANSPATERRMATVFTRRAGHQLTSLGEAYGKFTTTYHLQPFSTMHLDDRYDLSNGLMRGSSSVYSYLLSGIAGLILLLACINFINLTLARSLRRTKEIGIRKVTGSTRMQLVGQFLGETFLTTLLAFIPAIILVYTLLPQFSVLTNKLLEFNLLLTPQTIGLFTGLVGLVTLLAGLYPAFLLSGFNPTQILYSRLQLSSRHRVGKSLVVIQFVIAIVLLIGTVVLHGQFNYIQTADVGYERANRVRIYVPWGREQQGELVKQTLRGRPGIEAVARKSGGHQSKTYYIDNRSFKSATEWIDDQYLNVVNVPVVAGRGLSSANLADSLSTILVNETFARQFLAVHQPAVGQVVYRQLDNDTRQALTVVGVVRDYQYRTLRDKPEPVLLQLGKPQDMNQLYVRLTPGQTQPALRLIEQTFKKLIPYQPFSYHFMEEDRLEDYADDARWKRLITDAALLAILIAALGLFGLVSLTVEQRTKEIGIRKVLGASILELNRLLSADFLKLVLIAFLIGAPIGWYGAQHWLDTFIYRMNLTGWLIGGVGLSVLLIALVTVSFQSIKAALANPVKSLRSE